MSFGYNKNDDTKKGRPKSISVDLFYRMVAERVDNNASADRAREYGEAILDVLYEQMNKNGYINWYGLGIFKVVGNPYGGKVMENVYDISLGEYTTREVAFKNVIKFKPSSTIVDGINAELEQRPRIRIGTEKRKRVEKVNPEDVEFGNKNKNKKYEDLLEFKMSKNKKKKVQKREKNK